MKDHTSEEIARMELSINVKDISYSRLMDMADFMRSGFCIETMLKLEVDEEILFRDHGLKIDGSIMRVA